MSSSTPLSTITSADLADAHLEQLHARLNFLWSASFSPLLFASPSLSSHYLRVMRRVGWENDVSIAHDATSGKGSFCPNCCIPAVPGVNTNFRLDSMTSHAKQERRKRQRRQRMRQLMRQQQQDQSKREGESDANMNSDGDDTTHSQPHTPKTSRSRTLTAPSPFATPASTTQSDRKRKRSSDATHSHSQLKSPFASATPTPLMTASASLSTFSSRASHALRSHCVRCGWRSEVGGQSHRARANTKLRSHSFTIDDLVRVGGDAKMLKDIKEEQEAEQKASEANRSKFLQSLQEQGGGGGMGPSKKKSKIAPNASAMENLSMAQQRLQQAKAQQSSADGVAALPTGVGSFFAEQFRTVTGAATAAMNTATATGPTAPAPPSSQPFTFSKASLSSAVSTASTRAPFSFNRNTIASTAAQSAASKPKVSLVQLLQDGGASSAPSHMSSASSVSSSNTTSARISLGHPPTMIQNIPIIGGMKSLAAASKTFTLAAQQAAANKKKKKR